MSKIIVFFILFTVSCWSASSALYNNNLNDQAVLESLKESEIEVLQALFNNHETARSIEGYFGSYQFIAPVIFIAAVAGSCCLYQCIKNKAEEVLGVRFQQFMQDQEAV